MSNTETVMAFIQAWNDMDWDAVENAFAEDVFYHNIPMEPIEGKAAATAFARGMNPQSVNWEVLNLSLIHISEPTRQLASSRMPSSA